MGVTVYTCVMKTNDTIWTAGFLDGTGSICLEHLGTERGPYPLVSFEDTDSSLLDALQEAHGGSISKRVREGQSDAWLWRIQGGNQVIEFLKPIYPYMRCAVKQRRAELIVTEYRSVIKRNGVYSAADLEAKRDFVDRFFRIGTKANKEAMNMVADR